MNAVSVVDSSVAIKWMVPEDGSDMAADLRRFDLIAPDLLRIECSNVLWRLVNGNALPLDEAFGSLDDLAAGTIRYFPCGELERTALEIAIELRHPIYDCYYLALAERENAPLVTDDRRLVRAARQHDRFRSLVLSLDEVHRIRP
ncbi:type II toxin-antitoxin system VapC family toxin [Azospirillum sp. sgz301742]